MMVRYNASRARSSMANWFASLLLFSVLAFQLQAADEGPKKETFTEILKLIGSDAPATIAKGHYELNGYYHEKGLRNIPDWQRKIIKKLILASMYDSRQEVRRAAITNLTRFASFLNDDDYRERCANVIAGFNQRQKAAFDANKMTRCEAFIIKKTQGGYEMILKAQVLTP